MTGPAYTKPKMEERGVVGDIGVAERKLVWQHHHPKVI